MDIHDLGHAAASQGWRKKAADAIAPRAPVDDRLVRTALGLLFLAMSVKYVATTVRQARAGAA